MMAKYIWIASLVVVSFCASSVRANSLFHEASFKPLTADRRAGEIGDTVTILVMENAQAKSSAGNSTESSSGMQVNARSANGQWPYGVGVSATSAGDAAINRNGFVKAQITAVVQNRDLNGNLEVAGSQEITIDGEIQSIEVRGWIRPNDITANNVVPSFRLFNARIRFEGEGDMTDNQNAGFFSRIINWLGF